MSLLLQASSVADEPQTKVDELLQVVRVPAKALPKGMQLAKRIATAPLIPIKRNPDAFVEPARIKSIAIFFGMRDQQDLALVRAVVTAIYQENKPANELGVYDLQFSDKQAAAGWFKKLTSGKEGTPFILKDKLLLYVWKDDGVSDEAFKSVRDYFKQQSR